MASASPSLWSWAPATRCSSVGIRNAERRQRGHGTPASVGRFTDIVGTFLAVLALIVFVVVATALNTTENSVGGLIDRIPDEIEEVDVPEVDAPDFNAPDVGSPDVNTEKTPR